MSIVLDFYPVITRELLNRIGFQASNYEFFYHIDGIKHDLSATTMESQAYRNEYLQITDERCEWVPDNYDLCFSRSYTINNPMFLFGENGVACEDAELGLALLWTSKSSNQRGVKVISGFKRIVDKPIHFEIEFSFPPAQMKGSINLQTILFLKSPGKARKNEMHLANSAGIILGSLDQSVIIIDGSGSVFPIVEVEEASQPLWWVSCDWNDPQVDTFEEENIKICLNKAHQNYNLLKLEDGLKGSPLLIEIIASAIQIIIHKVKDTGCWEEIVAGQNIEPGSIAHAVYYFINTFEWKTDSPENLALTIRKYFDVRV